LTKDVSHNKDDNDDKDSDDDYDIVSDSLAANLFSKYCTKLHQNCPSFIGYIT